MVVSVFSFQGHASLWPRGTLVLFIRLRLDSRYTRVSSNNFALTRELSILPLTPHACSSSKVTRTLIQISRVVKHFHVFTRVNSSSKKRRNFRDNSFGYWTEQFAKKTRTQQSAFSGSWNPTGSVSQEIAGTSREARVIGQTLENAIDRKGERIGKDADRIQQK